MCVYNASHSSHNASVHPKAIDLQTSCQSFDYMPQHTFVSHKLSSISTGAMAPAANTAVFRISSFFASAKASKLASRTILSDDDCSPRAHIILAVFSKSLINSSQAPAIKPFPFTTGIEPAMARANGRRPQRATTWTGVGWEK